MKSLGIVHDMNHKGELLLQASSAQRPGTWVFDRRKKKIGHVLRTIGPVRSPYVLVKVTGIPDAEKIQLMNSELFSNNERNCSLKGEPSRGFSGETKLTKM